MNFDYKIRLNKAQILELFDINNILELGILADKRRKELHKNSKFVTFVVDRNISYTNVCSCKCKFCAFYKDDSHKEAYFLGYEIIKDKIRELVLLGGTQVLLQGGLNESLPLGYYFDLISRIRADFPELAIHAFSPPEIDFIARKNSISVEELLKEFISCGLSSIPGGGAEILADNIRKKISPDKIASQDWLNVMEIAHNLGLSTTATMVFGFGESNEDVVEHLLKIRDLQDRTGKLTAFIPWSFSPDNTKLMSSRFVRATGVDYLRILAISRLVLDNIPNIQVSWVTQSIKIAQLSLNFGANDFGGTMLEENVLKSTGTEYKVTIDEIIDNIRQAGFIPAQRNTGYKIIKEYR